MLGFLVKTNMVRWSVLWAARACGWWSHVMRMPMNHGCKQLALFRNDKWLQEQRARCEPLHRLPGAKSRGATETRAKVMHVHARFESSLPAAKVALQNVTDFEKEYEDENEDGEPQSMIFKEISQWLPSGDC